jgi:two-component system chemotaxis sensor kinase CheA
LKACKLAQETAHLLQKKVEFVLEGENLEIDKGAADLLSEALIHLMRNAVDHGLELPSERRVSGKSEIGKLYLSASIREGKTVISLKDDGRGLNFQKIRELAEEKGWLKNEDDLSEAKLARFILKAGFSTRSNANEISGQGVGMDVVKHNIEDKLQGQIQIFSKQGQGTEFKLEIPLQVGVVDGLVLRKE